MIVSDLVRSSFQFLDQPKKVLMTCTIVLVVGLIFDGTLFHLYGFYQQEDRLKAQIQAVQNETMTIQQQLEKTKDPQFVERLARDRFDMVADDELIFVFDE